MEQLPVFFHDDLLEMNNLIDLQDETVRHVVQVLRMGEGDKLSLTNGKGYKAIVTIEVAAKRKCSVRINDVSFFEERKPKLHLAVALTKNSNRNEWLLEKVTELGVATIIPLQTGRSEREKFRADRFRKILVAALIQSQQYYLPDLRELTRLTDIVEEYKSVSQKLVAHCMDDAARLPISGAIEKQKETLLLIGPEGDFTQEEVNQLTSVGYKGISMGSTRLRTETAAVTACAIFNMLNHV